VNAAYCVATDEMAWSVCLSVCLSVGHDREPCIMTELIEMPIGLYRLVGGCRHKNHACDNYLCTRPFRLVTCGPAVGLIRSICGVFVCAMTSGLEGHCAIIPPTGVTGTCRRHGNRERCSCSQTAVIINFCRCHGDNDERRICVRGVRKGWMEEGGGTTNRTAESRHTLGRREGEDDE